MDNVNKETLDWCLNSFPRPVLFRGKSAYDPDAWVYGVPTAESAFDLIQLQDETEHFYPIIKDSLTECTGLRDGDGNLIFEGDLLATSSGWNTPVPVCVVNWCQGAFHVSYGDHGGRLFDVLYSAEKTHHPLCVIGDILTPDDDIPKTRWKALEEVFDLSREQARKWIV